MTLQNNTDFNPKGSEDMATEITNYLLIYCITLMYDNVVYNNKIVQAVYQVATGSGKPVILAVNFAGPLSDVSTFCSGVTTTGGFTAVTTIDQSIKR